MAAIIFDISSGIAGDMIVGAAMDLGLDPSLFLSELHQLPLEFNAELTRVQRGAVSAFHFSVTYPKQHLHRHLHPILEIIQKSGLPLPVQKNSSAIFTRLAEAEAKVHGTSIEKVHFHEVGAVDAIVDIVGASLAFNLLDATSFFTTPFTFGHGSIKTEHGVLPLPAPATVALTCGFPAIRLDVEGELVTPTGAAVATTLSRPVSELGPHRLLKAGYGAGTREIAGMPNVLRLLLVDEAGTCGREERVVELETNVDDASGEVLGRAVEKLFQDGALDVFLTPIQMKKGRPASLITVLAKPEDRERLAKTLLAETGSIGLRISEKERLCLSRSEGRVQTSIGEIRTKVIDFFGEKRMTPEYESVRALSEQTGVPVQEIYRMIPRFPA